MAQEEGICSCDPNFMWAPLRMSMLFVLPPSPKSMNYFLFRPSRKSMNFLILKNSNNILSLHIILFTSYTISINFYTIIIMWTPLSTNVISTTLSLSLSLPLLLFPLFIKTCAEPKVQTLWGWREYFIYWNSRLMVYDLIIRTQGLDCWTWIKSFTQIIVATNF